MAKKDKTESKQKLPVMTGAPHIRSGESVPKVMWSVVAALAPAAAFAVYHFGMPALMLMAVSAASAVAAEALMQLLLRKRVTALDGSAVITGLLLAMNIPPGAPLWMAAIGSVFAMVIVKHLFGGLGFNIFNPALAARAFLLASWPVHMTTTWHRFGEHNILMQNAQNSAGFSPSVFDALTGATPLTLMKEGPKILADNHIALSKLYDVTLTPEMVKSLFIGTVGGSIGETSALLLLIGALFLMIRKIITWHIPVSFIGTVAAAAAGYHYLSGYPAPHLMALYQVLSGGLILGAFFMATDMVTSPVSKKGMLIFGAGCGLITFVIRQWGGYPEGVSYAILIMNALVPLIDRYTKPRVFGVREKKKLAGAVK